LNDTIAGRYRHRGNDLEGKGIEMKFAKRVSHYDNDPPLDPDTAIVEALRDAFAEAKVPDDGPDRLTRAEIRREARKLGVDPCATRLKKIVH
jgi:hypothetical protein